jgi:hypothetical protein
MAGIDSRANAIPHVKLFRGTFKWSWFDSTAVYKNAGKVCWCKFSLAWSVSAGALVMWSWLLFHLQNWLTI